MLLLDGVVYWVPNTQHQSAATLVDNTRSCCYSEYPIQNISQQQNRWTIPEAVVTVSTQYTTPVSSKIGGQYQKL